jgi:hypothetical protein
MTISTSGLHGPPVSSIGPYHRLTTLCWLAVLFFDLPRLPLLFLTKSDFRTEESRASDYVDPYWSCVNIFCPSARITRE